MLWDMTISKSLDRYLQHGRGDRCMEDTDHPIVHPRVHLGDSASAQPNKKLASVRGENLGEARGDLEALRL